MNSESTSQNVLKKKTICSFLPVLLLIGVCSLVLFWIAGSYLITGDRVRNVDAIVVLSGDEGARVKEASKLFRSGLAKYLIITKSDHENIQEDRTNSEKMMRIAISEGVASDAIIFTNQEAGDTIGEAKEVLEVAKQRHINSLLVITDPYHTRRTKILFKHIFKGSEITTSVHGISDHWYKSYTWFLSLEGWRITLQEYASIFFFAIGNSIG